MLKNYTLKSYKFRSLISMQNKEVDVLKESKVVLIVVFVITFLSVITVEYFSNKIIERIGLEKAEKVIRMGNQNEIEVVTKEELEMNDNIIGTFEIPKLGVVAPIKEGCGQEILKVAVGHFEESSLWEGNVALASHNRSRYAHYFEQINELQNGDEIIYRTKLGTKKYSVYENRIIESTDWSVIENTKENIITLITCVKNNQAKRLCVRAKEI